MRKHTLKGPNGREWEFKAGNDGLDNLVLSYGGDPIATYGTGGAVQYGSTTTAALLQGAGTSDAPVTNATANVNFIGYWVEHTATSGDNRGMYLRTYFAGAGGGGDAARIFATVDDVTATTVHGAHTSLSFAEDGSVSGQGVASRNTLHIPDNASWAPGTIAALQAEIWSDGDASDTDGATQVSFMRFVNGGNATGVGNVDDDAYLFTIEGCTVGAGNMVVADGDETKFSHKIRIKVGSTTMYLMAADS